MKTIVEILQNINLCGCGRGHWEVVLKLLDRAAKQESFKQPAFYQPFEDASQEWAEFGAKVLNSYGLLEHGSGIGSAWLTEDGLTLLTWLREHGVDSDEWPEEERRA